MTTAPARWRLGGTVEVEDVVLLLWLVALEWLLVRAIGGDPLWLLAGDDHATVVALAAIAVLVAVVVFTRGPEDTDLDTAIGRRVLLFGPAFPLVSIYGAVGDYVRRDFGRRDEPPQWPGLPMPSFWRRTAALPVALVGDALFRHDSSGSLPRLSDITDATGVFVVVGVAAAYVFFVVGPRVAAGSTLRPWPWIVRFLLVLVAAWSGQQWQSGFLP